MFSGDNLFKDMQNLADSIRSDVEKQLNQSFKQFDVLEHQALEDPEHTSYFMKVKTDDNGHVKVKTTRHEPGQDWKTTVEEYDKGNALEGGQRINPAIESKQNYTTSTTETSNP
uniref:Uncharacterized protein n=1 Tax=Rhipicephalus microplus TaxID=6941 RepID=A0A6G5AH53_RHIMP